MRSHEIKDLIQKHAERLDTETPPLRFDELRGPAEVQVAAPEWRRGALLRGWLVAAGAALAVLLAVGGSMILLNVSNDTGPITDTVATTVTTVAPPSTATPPATVTTTTNPEAIEKPDLPSPSDEARLALADALIVIVTTGDLSRHVDALWAGVSDPASDTSTPGWLQGCCAEDVAAIRGLLPMLRDQSNACEAGYGFVPCTLTNDMKTALDDIEIAIAAGAAADGRDRATESLADASYGLIRFNERLTELIMLDLGTFLTNAGSPSHPLKDDALQDVLETLALTRDVSAQLTLVSAAIEDPSFSVDTADWVENWSGDLVRLDDILSHLHVAADACEAGYVWVPCSLTHDIGAEIDRMEAALAEFRSATSHNEGAHALAMAVSALTRINQPIAELIRINICVQGGNHPGAAEVTRCSW